MVESSRAHSVVRGTRIGRSDRKHGCVCHRFSFFLLLSFLIHLLQGRGCLEERVAETPLPPLASWQAKTTGPGDRKKGEGDVHGQNVPLSTSVDTPRKINTSIILKVAGCLESRMERTEEAFAGFPAMEPVMRTTSQAGRKIRRAVGRDLQGRWRTIRKRRGPIRRKRQGRSHRQHNWSWPSLMDWTFRPSRRSVICLRGPGPRFTSRGRRSGWSGPPRSGDEGRPRPWRSSWVDEGVNITRAGTAPCDNDQSAASMPLTSQRTEECGPPVCTIVRSVGC